MAVAENQDYNTLTLNLYRLGGVAGLMLQKGENILANHMPFSEKRTCELGSLITKMCEGYATVQRKVRQVLVSYDAGALLIVAHQQAQLIILLTSRAELDVVSNAAIVFMSEQAERLVFIPTQHQTNELRDPLAIRDGVAPVNRVASNGVRVVVEQAKVESSRWPDIRKALEATLGKVMGRAQVSNLIERVSKEMGHTELGDLDTQQGKLLAEKVVEQVPNRSKRMALLSELEQALEDLKL